MKVCGKCRQDKPLSAFTKGRGRYGLRVWCRDCSSAYDQTPERREAKRSCSRKYHTENRDVRKAIKARYRASIKGRALQLRDNSSIRAERLGLEFNLTREWVEQKLLGVCELTGREFDLTLPPKGVRANPNAPSLDRKDNSKGYTEDNVRMVVVHANVARNEFSDADLLALAYDIIRTISSQASKEEGSTAISQESRDQAVPKRPASLVDDDMVSSMQ